MEKVQLTLLIFLCYFQVYGIAARSIKICIKSGFEKQCDQLDRESPEVECNRVQDSVECAKLLRGGTAGFGIFSAESMLLLAALKYDGLTVLKELRHRDRLNHTADFEAVVLVKSNYEGGIKGLKGLKYCHPGFYYGRSERWSERFLKQFERGILTPDCDSPLGKNGSPAEIEIATVANYFGSSCRPGAWSNNPQEDQRLKAKYPHLCELCSSKTSPCEYTNINRHVGALDCLVNKGQVAYVSLQDVQEFFSASSENAHLRDEYAYLCLDGTKQSISDETRKPCTWISQPWPAIVASAYKSIELSQSVSKWTQSSYSWENAIKEILSADSLVPTPTTIQEPRSVFRPYREVPYHYPLCSTTITWCTKSLEEKDKCEVIRAAGLTAGVYPSVECQEPVMGTLGCLKEVHDGRADFTVIDSNYGFIARDRYNLTTALYGETDAHALAGVVVRANSTYKNLKSIAGVTACVNEYNGIASMAFINNGKKIGLFDKKNCNHSQILRNFFGSSCVPGASDPEHNVHQSKDNLCTLCPHTRYGNNPSVEISTRELIPDSVPLAQDVTTNSNLQNELDVLNSRQNCNADQSNRFYGDKGALLCLMNKGDVAILGLKNLNEHAKELTIDPQYYQVICRNGSLADHTGFDIDSDCALATYVDSEIVIRSNSTKRDGIINALLSFDEYLQIDPDFKMYGTFEGHKNVLFNQQTVGLVSRDEKDLGPDIDSYNKLLNEVHACGRAGFTSAPIASIIIGIMLFSMILNRLQQ